MNRKTDIFYLTLKIILALASLLAAWFLFFPFVRVKAFFDALTPDKNMEAFTATLYKTVFPIVLSLGVGSFLGLALLQMFPQKSREMLQTLLEGMLSFPSILRSDARSFWQSTKKYFSRDYDWAFLLALMFLGAYLRSLFLSSPMTHDEAYTYVSFILSGFKNLISDYHLPNNHILYSIFAYLAVHIFGNAPWVLRLPALLAGTLLIPASYLAAREYFNRHTALLTSGIVTTFPVFILYGSSARGYAQLALLTMLLWFFADLLLKKRNLFLWLLFVITAAAGFYTIPIMLYPYTASMSWLFLSWLFGEYSEEYTKKGFFKDLFFSGLVVVVLFGLLYLPVFLRSGIASVLNNDTIILNQEATFTLLRASFLTRTVRAWEEWHWGIPAVSLQITLTGTFIALFFHRLCSRKRANFFLISVLVIMAIVALQRSVGWMRVWFFFAPIYFSFATAGLVYLIQWVSKRSEKITFGVIAVFVLLSLVSTVSWIQQDTQEMRQLRGEPAALELGLKYLSTVLTEQDAIVAASGETPAMQYYAAYYDIPLAQTYPADNRYTSVYALLTNPNASVAETLHSGTSDRVDLNASELVYQTDALRIYKVPIVIFYEE